MTDTSSSIERRSAWADHLARGLWRENPALVQLLGLCPLLAVSTSAANALALSVATAIALLGSSTLVSLTRHRVPREVRLPVYVLILATMVTVVDLLLAAGAPVLHERLGIFVPLIVTNCAVLARAEVFASRNGVGEAAADALATGLGFGVVLTALGALRELVGTGTLFGDAGAVFGPWAEGLRIELAGEGVLVALLPPGAFLSLAVLAMARNRLRRTATRPEETT